MNDPPRLRSASGAPSRRAWRRRAATGSPSRGLPLAPVLTLLLAFLISGIVVLLTTGRVDTLKTYRAIFGRVSVQVGATMAPVQNEVWFPWNTDDFASLAASNLQQTLLLWTVLVLVGLAVAFAFRCGLFNIGGNGQYLAARSPPS